MRTEIRNFVALATAALLLLPGAASADEEYLDLVLARDACSSSDELPPDPRLAFSPGASTFGCGSALAIAGGSTTNYPAKEGVPVTLDDTRNLYVAISTGSFTGAAFGGIGNETVEWKLRGKNELNRTVTIAEGSHTTPAADMLRKSAYVQEFDVAIEGKGGLYKSLVLSLRVGGSQFSGFVDHDGTSFISLPVPDGTLPAE